MSHELIKEAYLESGGPVMTDTLLYSETLICNECPQRYFLKHSGAESLEQLRPKGQAAVNASHPEHELIAIAF
jgi:hypothetical protein